MRPSCRHDPPRLGERLRPVDEVEHERHRDPVEPPVAERQPLGRALPHADAGRERLAGDGDHLRAGVDAPGLRVGLLDEGREQSSRAAADVEHAPAAEVAELDERRECLPPRRVGRAQRVVDPRAGAEVGCVGALTRRLGCAPGRGHAGRRAGRAPARRARGTGSRSRRSRAARPWRGTAGAPRLRASAPK